MSSQGGDRSLEQTPTWAVAVVCFVLVAISIVIEHIIHLIGMWLTKKNKKGLFEALEKIKSELMLMGFISLLLTVGQGTISEICIPEAIGDTWTPCDLKDREIEAEMADKDDKTRRRLLAAFSDSDSNSDSGWSIDHRRVLTDAKYNKCAQGKVPFVSTYGIHQLHIFIFVLAVSHILYCIITLALGRAKMRKWKSWEMGTRTTEYQFSHDPERFRFARETSFGRRHLHFWSQSPILLWIVCFFRQFVRSVPEVDYLTLRHGFIIAHLAPQSQENFDFHKYIKRSLEEDTKVVVGINPIIWFCAILFLLFNTNGWYSYYWLPFIPLIIILLVGTKLQVVITKMGLRIEDRGEVVRGVPLVQPGDDLFWFNSPHLLLYLIHFVLFQNAFQIAFFIWAWYEFGFISCFHEKVEDIVIRLSMGVLIQILCSYVTLPLYALVTQMGSNMKPTIFNERVAKALHNWHQTAKKHIKQNRQSGAVTPLPSRPSTPPFPLHGTTPLHGLSPVHLLSHYRSELDTSPRISNFDKEFWEGEGSVSPSPRKEDEQWSPKSRNHYMVEDENEGQEPSSTQSAAPQTLHVQHTVDISHSKDFSFDKRSRF